MQGERSIHPLVAVLETLDVVIAVHEQLLDMPSVGSAVCWKDLVPGLCDVLELGHKPVVGEIAYDHHGIHALVAIPAKGLAEYLGRIPVGYVYVAHDAELESGCAGNESATTGYASGKRERRHTGEKRPS